MRGVIQRLLIAGLSEHARPPELCHFQKKKNAPDLAREHNFGPDCKIQAGQAKLSLSFAITTHNLTSPDTGTRQASPLFNRTCHLTPHSRHCYWPICNSSTSASAPFHFSPPRALSIFTLLSKNEKVRFYIDQPVIWNCLTISRSSVKEEGPPSYNEAVPKDDQSEPHIEKRYDIALYAL